MAIEPPEYTIQEAAAKLGIAEQKLRRWDAQGVLVARRTEGGHRRYSREIVDGLAGSSGLPPQKQDVHTDELDRARQDIKEKRRIIQLLVESESRYRDLVETSHDLIWTTDAVGRFTYLNNGTVDIFGLDPTALIGRCFFDFESQPSHISNRRFLSTLHKDGEVKNYLTHLVAADGTDRWVGINARVWHDNGRIVGLRGTARNVTDLHRAALQIEHLATHDTLTGLPNKSSLMRALEQRICSGGTGAVLRIDVDQFKAINEKHGYSAGDDLLVAVGAILRDQVSDRDATVFRYCSDQFAVHLRGEPKSSAEALAEDVLHALRHFTPRLPGSAGVVQLTASVGIAAYPEHGSEATTLLGNAEGAVNEAKARGRNCFVTHCLQAQEIHDVDVRAHWKHVLREALDEDRLVLYSQTIFGLSKSHGQQRELLARIVERDGNIIEPAEFIGAAESVGLIQEIDLRIIDKILAHLGNDQSASPVARYFVNLSRASVFDPYWLPRFYARLSGAQIDRSLLVFEISESAAMYNVEMAKTFFTRLKELGCGCALDDFGMGFTSLYYLKQFDVDYLKVDGTFVRELPNDEANRLFMRALCDVAKGLQREVIAEWVETPEILSELESLGVEYAQGHYVGRPARFATYDSEAARIGEDDRTNAKAASPAVTTNTVEP